MPTPIKLPPVKYLRTCFTYDPKTGILRWKRRPREHFINTHRWKIWNASHAGKNAGTIYTSKDLSKYYLVGFDARRYYAHRIIYKLMTGKEPPLTIDHKNGNGLDNRWDELRSATEPQQKWNAGKRKHNTSGYKGVGFYTHHFRSKPWYANITVNYTHYFLGYFTTAKEASRAYQAAARKLHGKFFRAT